MLKDTNPDHYKVDGANFIKYMNDPKISGFGNWMFANGFNSGVWASTNWISVKDRLPEGECIAYSRKSGEMMMGFIGETDEGDTGYCCDSNTEWLGDVTHWTPLPEPPKEESDD